MSGMPVQCVKVRDLAREGEFSSTHGHCRIMYELLREAGYLVLCGIAFDLPTPIGLT